MQSSQKNQLKQSLIKASQFFYKGQYQNALNLYNSLLQETMTKQQRVEVLKNRSFLYFTIKDTKSSLSDLQQCLLLDQEANPEIYVSYINILIKDQQITKALSICQQAVTIFPYHKKIQQLKKLILEKQITANEENYVEKVFQKLCQHPKIRQYLKDQSFLTKLQRLIRNPSLGPVLEKADPRIREAADFMMMAEEN